MKKSWNQPNIYSLSIALTKSGSTTYWNETCIQENTEKKGPPTDYYNGGEFQSCGQQSGAPLYYGNDDQGSQIIPPPSAASAGS